MATEMTSRERITRAVNHQDADRVAIQDAIWATTEARWRREGLPEGVSPTDYFGFEMVRPGADTSLRFPAEVLEETDEYRIHRNSNGRVAKDWKDQTSTPMLIGYEIETPDDWLKHKGRLEPAADRIDWDAFDRGYRNAREKGQYFCLNGGVGYQVITSRVHPDRLLEAMITDPEWVKDMVDAQTDLVLALFEMVVDKGYELDGYWCSDDLGYRNGLMFSPKVFRELFVPAHRGISTFLHTCGNVNEVVDDLIETGWDCLQPLEVKAQMDVVQLKRDYGDRVTLMGGIDVRVMAEGTDEELEEEVRSKLTVAKEHGGYIYHSDHSVPDNVSFGSYSRTMELVKEYGRYG
jgi:uroporphyrinogen decarboxylase